MWCVWHAGPISARLPKTAQAHCHICVQRFWQWPWRNVRLGIFLWTVSLCIRIRVMWSSQTNCSDYCACPLPSFFPWVCSHGKEAESLGEERDTQDHIRGGSMTCQSRSLGPLYNVPVHVIILLSKLLFFFFFAFFLLLPASNLFLEHFSDLDHEMTWWCHFSREMCLRCARSWKRIISQNSPRT